MSLGFSTQVFITINFTNNQQLISGPESWTDNFGNMQKG